ncbi:MAG TPA: glycosyltransferase family 2 protein [Myxococcales bacterium]|nr:glycosyltransferase family 2 protein [Myxococcales bacterium]
MPSLCIIIPAFNEAGVIAATLARIPAAIDGADQVVIAVVDDGSSDATAEIVRGCGDPRVVLMRHLANRGLGGALGTGLAYAKLHGFDYAITYDADGQHAPEDIAVVLGPLAAGTADAVIGSRMLSGEGMPFRRTLGNWGLSFITSLMFGLHSTDSQSGLRGFSRRAIEGITLRTDRMEVSSEFIKQIHDLRLRYAEVPIRAIYTDYSLAKGQRSVNVVSILLRLLVHALMEK